MTPPAPAAASGTLIDEATTPPSRNGKPASAATLGKVQWERAVRKKLNRMFAGRSLLEAQADWAVYLAQRREASNIAALFGGKRSPLLWGLPLSVLDDDARLGVERLHDCARGKRVKSPELEAAARSWLEQPASAAAGEGIVALAWAYALPSLASRLDGTLWWQLFHRLREMAAESSAADFAADSLPGQLFGAELPRVLAYQFPELEDARALAEASRRTLSESLPEMLDGQGAVHARHISIYRALVACWTRCAWIAEAAGNKCWNRAAATQYEWAVRHLLRTARHDGAQALTNEPTYDGPRAKELMQAALKMGGNKIDRILASIALPDQKARTTAAEWEAPSTESEWAECAVLRRDWSRKSTQLHVAFDAGTTIIELTQGKRMLFQGLHGFDVTIDGRLVQPLGDSRWELVCWESDDDVDYIELEMHLERGVSVQRSYLSIREDDVLLVSDVVLSSGAGKLRHRIDIALADSVVFKPESDTRDGWLVSDKRLARVLPLALPEWRIDPRGGQLFVEDGALVVEQEVDGSALMAPLLLDLNRRRAKLEGTWRQLTVAEERRVQPRDVAVGYRAQVGDDQWLVYRSLAPKGIRTVLGQHLNVEFYCGRFDADGEAEQLISVE